MQIPEEIFDGYKKSDSRGRITLGSKYADKKIKIAVLEVKEKK